MINLTSCDRMWKKCHSFAEQDYFTSMWNTFSVCLFRSAEITEAISLALHSVSQVLRISLVLPVFLRGGSQVKIAVFRAAPWVGCGR